MRIIDTTPLHRSSIAVALLWCLLPHRLTVPLPYRLPPEAYSASDKPWTVDEPHAGLDALGTAIFDEHTQFSMGRLQEDD